MAAFKFLIIFILCPVFCFSQDIRQITKRQVDSYENQKWDQFFGTAIGYRKYLYAENPNNNLIYLEALALIEHCQFDLAIQLMNSLSQSSGFFSNVDQAKIDKTLNLIPGIKNMPLNKRAFLNKQSAFKSNRWKLVEANKNIPLGSYRSHVENLCKK